MAWRGCAIAAAAWALCAAALPAAAAPGLAPWSGQPAPPLALKDVQGGTHDLARYQGKVVLVNFWATWCEPCRHEMPSIQRLRDRFAGKPFAVLAVNVDEPHARVRKYIAQTGLDLPVVIDVNKTVTRAWGVRVLPTTILVDPDGRARYRLIGAMDWNNETVVRIISQLIAGGIRVRAPE